MTYLNTPSAQIATIKIELELWHDETIFEKEIIANIIPSLTTDCKILFYWLLTQLEKLGYSLEDNHIWYYSKTFCEYVYCGSAPISKSITIDCDELDNMTLKLKFEMIERKKVIPDGTKEKIRGRTISEVLRTVGRWRTYINEGYIINGRLQKLSSEKAAEIVGYHKKTLDDYYQKIQSGYKIGFDFNAHGNDQMGTLVSHIMAAIKN